jgi:hypothetical protein
VDPAPSPALVGPAGAGAGELDTAAGPDDDGVLVVLGRRDLGADPEQVARELRALDPTG